MISLDNNYTILRITIEDAFGIHVLMSANGKRFKRYFPKTLEDNSTLEKSKTFALLKVKSFEVKEEFLFVLKNLNKIIGLIYLKELDWHKKQGEFAYCIDSGHKGKGLIGSAIKELSQYAFVELGLEVLQIIVHKDNVASVKVAEKSGFLWQKTLLKGFTPPNESPLDMELYELYK